MTSHTMPWKEAQSKELTEMLSKYKVLGLADLNEFPTALFQKLRKKLSGKAKIRVSKTRIVQRALENSKFKGLSEKAKGKTVAVIFSEVNPFELFAFIKKNKGLVFAKEGMIAEKDIIIPAGDSGLPPGPALTDLKGLGLQVKVAGPTIEIIKDKTVVKAGDEIDAKTANVLAKLDIKPIKIGLSLIAVQENNDIFLANVLDIDEEQVFNNFVSAQRKAFNLAVNSVYFCNATTELLLQKAFREAKAVSVEANIVNSATIGDILGKAQRTAKLIKEKIPEEKKE
ncbi:MAG: 50S ribosomal protein L10 [Candidatus Diapherotrites archaeon]|nr:50S ribosomal protein L10 [Candidatus Diapherotrites archaeon]